MSKYISINGTGLASATLLTTLAMNVSASGLESNRQITLPSIEITCYKSLDTTFPRRNYVFPKQKNYREMYKNMVAAEWYKQAYHNRSVGDLMRVEY